jgi:hypothetical protein
MLLTNLSHNIETVALSSFVVENHVDEADVNSAPEPEVVDAVTDLANTISNIDGVSEGDLAEDIVDAVKDANDGEVPADLTNIANDLEDVQNKINDAHDVLKNDDATKEEKKEAHNIISEGSEQKQQLLSDLISDAANVPGVDAKDVSDVLISAAAEANDGELPADVQKATSELYSEMCDCHGHGDCVEGVCECHEGWRGVECSIEEIEPPAPVPIEDMTLSPESVAILQENNPTISSEIAENIGNLASTVSNVQGVSSIDVAADILVHHSNFYPSILSYFSYPLL